MKAKMYCPACNVTLDADVEFERYIWHTLCNNELIFMYYYEVKGSQNVSMPNTCG
jgi:hypothetical protein